MELSKSDRNGWKAETVYKMGDAGNDMRGRPMTRELHLSTSKDSDGILATRATVYSVGPTMRQHSFGMGGGGDFSRNVTKTRQRCTEKTVREQHAAAEATSEALLVEAHAHYAGRKSRPA